MTHICVPRLPRWIHGIAIAVLALGLASASVACSPPAPPAADRELARPAQEPAAEPRAAEPVPAAPAPAADPPNPNAAQPTAQEITAARLQMLDPSRATRTAPERFTVVFETTRGDLHLDVRRSWAPLGADRFYNLVKLGFYEDVAFFRVISGFVAQAGLHGDPAVNALWRTQRIDDDPVTQSNLPGMVTFAMGGKNSRTTQFFINLGDNANLDKMGFAPFGRVRELDVLRTLHAGYGEGAPNGRGPAQARIQREGNGYLKAEFPELDYIKRALIVDEKSPSTGTR